VGLLEDCIFVLGLQPHQTAEQLASILNRQPSTVSSVLLQNARSRYAKVKREAREIQALRNGLRSVWVYSLYHD